MQLGNQYCASCVDRDKEWCLGCRLVRFDGGQWGMSLYRPRNGLYTISTQVTTGTKWKEHNEDTEP